MNDQMLVQMMQDFLPPESREVFNSFQEISELQQMILSHASRGGDNWQVEMLEAIRPRVPERNRHTVDVLIKCAELSALLKRGNVQSGYRSTF